MGAGGEEGMGNTGTRCLFRSFVGWAWRLESFELILSLSKSIRNLVIIKGVSRASFTGTESGDGRDDSLCIFEFRLDGTGCTRTAC
jgi:hypothetical protein